MSFNRDQRQIAFKKLSPEVQSYVMSNETTESIENILKESDLSEEQTALADGEILSTLLGLQTLDTAISNIARTGNLPTEKLASLKENFQEKVFNQLEELKSAQSPTSESASTNLPETAPDIHPMVEKGEVAHDAPHMEQPVNPPAQLPEEQAPPIEQKKEPSNPEQTSYPQGKDPYREPIE